MVLTGQASQSIMRKLTRITQEVRHWGRPLMPLCGQPTLGHIRGRELRHSHRCLERKSMSAGISRRYMEWVGFSQGVSGPLVTSLGSCSVWSLWKPGGSHGTGHSPIHTRKGLYQGPEILLARDRLNHRLGPQMAQSVGTRRLSCVHWWSGPSSLCPQGVCPSPAHSVTTRDLSLMGSG